MLLTLGSDLFVELMNGCLDSTLDDTELGLHRELHELASGNRSEFQPVWGKITQQCEMLLDTDVRCVLQRWEAICVWC